MLPNRNHTPLPFYLADGANLDAFGRLRVADPVTLFDSQFQYGINPFFWSSALSATGGGAAKTANESSVTLSCTTTADSIGVLQTKQYIRYQPGKSQFIVMANVIGAATANVRKRWGYFDANDGVFFEQNGTTDLAIVIRSSASGSPVDTRITQANWNIDPMDGSGYSKITLDLTKINIFIIDLQWLSAGRVRFGLDIDGDFVPLHQAVHANRITTQYMVTANLPLRYECTNLVASAGSFKPVCAAVISEGGFETERSLKFAKDNGTTAVTLTTGGTAYALLGLRPVATHNGVTNRGQISRFAAEIYNADVNIGCRYEIRLNPTVAGTFTYGALSAGRSIAEVAVGISSNTVTGGDVLDSGYLQGGGRSVGQALVDSLITLSQYDTNSRDALVVCATPITNGGSAMAALTWRENW